MCVVNFTAKPSDSPSAIDEAYEAAIAWSRMPAVRAGHSMTFIVHLGAAGAYICGEETALIESLEGKKGQPRLEAAIPGQCRSVWPARRR